VSPAEPLIIENYETFEVNDYSNNYPYSSSDTDLIPAFEKVRSMKKQVEYIGFSHKPSYGLIAHSDI